MFLAFLKTIGVITGVVWGCMALPLYLRADARVVWGVAVGCLVSMVCFTAGFYAVCRSFHRSSRALMISIFGGMLARLVFIGAIVILLRRLTSLPMVSLLSSLLGFYLVYLIIELYFVHNRLGRKERYP
jgi:hypothetical protein